MPVLPRFTNFFRTLTSGGRLDAELDDELRAYVDLLTDEKIAAGLAPETARREALLETGGVEQVKERVRDVRLGSWVDTVWQDVRYALRGFRKAPWFTATAVASLALGIGLNTALFSAIEAMLLKPLPYKDADRVVSIDQTLSTWGPEPSGVWPGVFDQWQRRGTSFESMGIYDRIHHDAILRHGDIGERVDVTRVSSGVFVVLGMPPFAGRALLPEDDRPGSRVAVLSYEFWVARWKGDPTVVGRHLLLDEASYRIVGVMPPGFRIFHYPDMGRRLWSDIYLSDPWELNPRSNMWTPTMGAIGRLKGGVTIERANSEVAMLAATTDYGIPPNAEWGTPKFGGTVSVWGAATHEVDSRLWLVWGIASALLLLAVANMANLMLARAGARRQELALRAAIGASRARLARQLLTESLMLALTGGLAGLSIAVWAAPLLATLIPDSASPMWRLQEAGVSWRVLGFMTAVAVVTGVAFGVAPALRGSKADQRVPLLASSRMTETPSAGRFRTALLVAQLALSLVLVAGAGLMLTSLARLWSRPTGFDPEGVLTFFVRLPRGLPYVTVLDAAPQAQDKGSAAPLLRQWAPTSLLRAVPLRLEEKLRSVPGVSAAAVATGIPMVRSLGGPFVLLDRPAPANEEQRWKMAAITARVLPGYFQTFGMRLLAGREISSADQEGGRRVAVIGQHMARTYWSHESRALGARFRLDGGTNDDRLPYEVIGIVNDVRFWMWDGEPESKIYLPFITDEATRYDVWGARIALHHNVALRMARGRTADIDAIRRAVAEVTDGTPIEQVRWLSSAMTDASGNTPGITMLLSSAAAVALLLAAIGIFGMVSYTVSLRTHEIGIRIALGASRRAVTRLVLSGALWIGAAGVVLGWLAAFWLSKLIAGELFPGVSPTDPLVFGAVALLLVAIVLLATWVPAHRAAAVDPAVALKAE